MAVVNDNFCLDVFTIAIGGFTDCELTLSSMYNFRYDVADITDTAETATVMFAYIVGSPDSSQVRKSNFASIYTAERQGGVSGSPLALGNRSFCPGNS